MGTRWLYLREYGHPVMKIGITIIISDAHIYEEYGHPAVKAAQS